MSIHMALLQCSSPRPFHLFSLQVPTRQTSHLPLLTNLKYILMSDLFSFHKRGQWGVLHEISPSWTIFPRSCLAWPSLRLEWCRLPFSVHIHLPSWPIFKPSLIFFETQASVDHMGSQYLHRQGWGRGDGAAVIDATGIWAAIMQLAGTLCFSLHLIADAVLPSYEELFLGSTDLMTDRSARTQITMGNSRYTVTWWPRVT